MFFFPSRIPDSNFFHPGSEIRLFSITDPRIQGSKKAPDSGSGSATLNNKITNEGKCLDELPVFRAAKISIQDSPFKGNSAHSVADPDHDDTDPDPSFSHFDDADPGLEKTRVF